MNKLVLLAASSLLVGSVTGQYTREWQSGNLGYNCWGASYGYDVDGDGVPNMYVRSSGQIAIYQNYSVYWTINFSGYDYPSLVTPRDIDGDGLVKPVNMDGDPAGEVVATAYRVSGQDLYGRIRVYDASSRQLEWDSGELSGFTGSASVDDVDGDGKHEVIITRYNYTGNWGYVEVYGYTGAGISGGYGPKLRSAVSGPTVGQEPSIRFQLAGRTAVRVALYDAAGRQVRQLVNTTLPAGEYQMSWDGTDDSGASLPAGVYLYQVECGEGAKSGHLVLAR
ncbi:MAG: FlgD immunoglobulin-like domain containing protein [candidate division WOR-3 bacterium]